MRKKVIQIDGVVGVYESLNDSKKDIGFFGTEPTLLEGNPYIVEKLGNISYRIYPNTFFSIKYEASKADDGYCFKGLQAFL